MVLAIAAWPLPEFEEVLAGREFGMVCEKAMAIK